MVVGTGEVKGLVYEVHLVDTRPAGWCDRCALPSSVDADFALVLRKTVRRFVSLTNRACNGCETVTEVARETLPQAELAQAFRAERDAVLGDLLPGLGSARAMLDLLQAVVEPRPPAAGTCGTAEGRCVCVSPAGHAGAHVCECGGSWEIVDGHFVVHAYAGSNPAFRPWMQR
jgi:hypothetical protein